MDISSRLEFPAPPDQVFAMLTDRAYLVEVCRASESLAYEASVDGLVTRTSRTLAAPSSAARFTGPELVIDDQTSWGDRQPDGSRNAKVTLAVQRQPVTFTADLRLTPSATGSVVDLTGNLKVAIPLVGKKFEQSTAPAVLAGFRTQQQVGDDWLAR